MTSMEYVYGAMLLHSAGKEINEENLKKVMDASGAKADATQIKALIASLEGVNIDEATKTAVPTAVAAAPVVTETREGKAEKKKEEKKEEKKDEDEAASGLASLFG